jgi:methyl-accepting chemotaxis protein
MNNAQRKVLKKLIEQLQGISESISDMASEEEEKFDNLSDGLQQTERGQKLEETKDELEDIESELIQLIDRLQELA